MVFDFTARYMGQTFHHVPQVDKQTQRVVYRNSLDVHLADEAGEGFKAKLRMPDGEQVAEPKPLAEPMTMVRCTLGGLSSYKDSTVVTIFLNSVSPLGKK